MKTQMNLLAKAGTTTLALCLAATSVAAGTRCASHEELTALKVAALRQELMVAGLTCHEASSFNRFVTSYQNELLASDHALMRFFVRQSHARADDAYNSYKTRLANDFSMRSIKDPWFCENAHASLEAALYRNLSLTELVSDGARPIHTGYSSCTADDADYTVAPAAPNFPSRHAGMADTVTPSTDLASGSAPLSPVPERQASAETKPIAPAAIVPATAPPPAAASAQPAPGNDTAQDESTADDTPPASDEREADNGPYNDPAPAYAYSQPYAYAQPYSYYRANPYGWYAAPRPMTQVQGPDGRWYLVPAYGR